MSESDSRSSFTERLLAWYDRHGRDLPWRDRPDPYAIWVSEIMLQQTRVEAVRPYYDRWMARFPTVRELAAATQQEVLAVWEGLGYYSRARNLHESAQIIVNEQGGSLPVDTDALRRLPGIGPYTAGAIASIAFDRDEAAVDGNVRRVLSRVFDVVEPVRTPEGERRFWALAGEHLPSGQAGAYNQALMDLGATICTPRAPACERCPLEDLCIARRLGIQESRPVRRDRPESPHHNEAAAAIRRDGQVLIARRPPEGLLGGLWEFPGAKLESGEDPVAGLLRGLEQSLGVEVEVQGALGVYRHAYTHFRVTRHVFCCTLVNGELRAHEARELRWVPAGGLEAFPMGKLDRQIARALAESKGTRSHG